MRRAIVLSLSFALLGFALIALWPRKPAPQSVSRWAESLGRTMGSTFSLRFNNPYDEKHVSETSKLLKELDTLIADSEKLISTWQPDSELSRFNDHRGDDWFPVNEHTVTMIELAREITAIDPSFDVTIEPLSNLWGFGPKQSKALQSSTAIAIPDQAAIDGCLSHVGIGKIETRREPPALRKTDPETRIDLSAIAAGYIADRVAELLKKRGVQHYYVDIAGEITVGGYHLSEEKWRIGIAEPSSDRQAKSVLLHLTDCAIATSGNYRNYRDMDGQRIGHILDATSGRPVETDILSATVIHESCARADALATLLMTMQSSEALELARKENLKILLLIRSDSGVKELRTF